MERVVERGGRLWPASDTYCHKWIDRDLGDLDRAVALVAERGVALQAGGNCGVWAAQLAGTFGEVHTVEPDETNFACLRANVPASVRCHFGALAARPGRLGLRRVAHNTGAHSVVEGGDVPALTIDGVGLRRLDLLVLDVEGYELPALQGGAATLAACRPVVMLEERGHGARYGAPRGAAERWLAVELGYSVAMRLGHDVILRPAETGDPE